MYLLKSFHIFYIYSFYIHFLYINFTTIFSINFKVKALNLCIKITLRRLF
nr:MAG TPA: hypothetical protein [Herelleviridae sp.]